MGHPSPLQGFPAGPEFLMNTDADRQINTIDMEASNGYIINNERKESTYLKLLQQNVVIPLSFDCMFLEIGLFPWLLSREESGIFSRI